MKLPEIISDSTMMIRVIRIVVNSVYQICDYNTDDNGDAAYRCMVSRSAVLRSEFETRASSSSTRSQLEFF